MTTATLPTTPKKRTLLDISEDLISIDDLLYEVEGDISDSDAAEAIDAWLEEAEVSLNDKTDSYVGLIRQKTLMAAARKEESERLALMAKQDDASAKFLKDRLKFTLMRLGRKSAGNLRKATVTANGGKVPLIFDNEKTAVPEDYQKQIVKTVPDTELIREALEAGANLGFVRLGEKGTHLRIK